MIILPRRFVMSNDSYLCPHCGETMKIDLVKMSIRTNGVEKTLETERTGEKGLQGTLLIKAAKDVASGRVKGSGTFNSDIF